MSDINPTAEPVTPAALTGVTFVAAYVDDFDAAVAFYCDLLELEKSVDMGRASCFLKINEDVGLYLEGGNAPSSTTPKTARASFGLTAKSVAATFRKLSDAGVRFVHDGPQEVGGGQAWFQCYDPAGNIIEIVGPL